MVLPPSHLGSVVVRTKQQAPKEGQLKKKEPGAAPQSD